MVNTYVSLDLETTGLNPKKDKIIEIGAVKVKEGIIVDTFQRMIHPGRLLDQIITDITGLTNEMVQQGEDIKDVIPLLVDFIGDAPLVGHSVLFDYSFAKRAAINVNKTFEKNGIDTLHIARNFLPSIESRTLGYLCQHYHLKHEAHRALGDALATHKLYQVLASQFLINDDGQEHTLFQPTPLHYQVKKEGPITRPQKTRLLRLLEKHQLEVTFDVDKMTKNEASRYTDKLLAKYGK